MSPENIKILRSKHPEMLSNREISVGDGWFTIVDRLFDHISQHSKDVKLVQLKEKLGTIRCYLAGGDDYCYKLVYQAEAESERTCEECGEPGTFRNDNGWFKVRCDPCMMVSRLTS